VRLSEAGNETDAQAVIRICQVMQAGEDRLVGYGDEVKAEECTREAHNAPRRKQAQAITIAPIWS